VTDARKFAFKFKNFSELLCEVRRLLSTRALTGKFEEIIEEADDLRQQRNLMLHSIWLPTSDPEQPFVRVKEDECDPEIDFDVQTVERLVDRMTQCGNSSLPPFL
jgi:hypothetical protein